MVADKPVNLLLLRCIESTTETLQVMERQGYYEGKISCYGMSCSACSSHVEKAVKKLENVEKASVNLLTETMDVTYDETKITSAEIIDAVVKAGYGASVMTEGSAAGAGGQSTSGECGKYRKSSRMANRNAAEAGCRRKSHEMASWNLHWIPDPVNVCVYAPYAERMVRNSGSGIYRKHDARQCQCHEFLH